MRYLLGERAKTKGETVKGELKAARRQTDLATAPFTGAIVSKDAQPFTLTDVDFIIAGIT